MAHSPYTEMAVGYVARNPGCCKYDLARFLARRCHPSKLYYLVNTQIRLNNILAMPAGNRYYLFVNDKVGQVIINSWPQYLEKHCTNCSS